MELGLSLGSTSTSSNTNTVSQSSKSIFLLNNKSSDHQKHSSQIKNINNGTDDFIMTLGRTEDEDEDEEEEEEDDSIKSQKSQKNDDVDKDDHTCEQGINGDSNNSNIPVQLDLLPLVPALQWSSDNGSSENGSSSGKAGLSAADVIRPPISGTAVAAGTEEVSSPNSVASSFLADSGFFRNIRNKRKSESARGNDGGCAEAERACSKGSDEDENGVNARKKLRLSKDQSAYLEESFKEHHTLNPKEKLALAKQLNLRPRQVEVWFQNRRARTKLKQTEVDCEYMKRCCETLTEENRRLHKEVQELRALKTSSSNPFYMQLPATTLTMCPSCEKVAATTTSAAAPPPTTATVATAAATTTTSTSTESNPNKVISFLSRPRFFPFTTNNHTPTHPHQSAAI